MSQMNVYLMYVDVAHSLNICLNFYEKIGHTGLTYGI